MAEIFDPFKAAPEAPSIADPFAPGYKPPTLAGEFGKGVAGGIDALQGAGYGLVGLAGDALGAKGVRDWGLAGYQRSEEHTSELQSPKDLVCRLLLEKKKK